VSFIEFVGW
nr:Chain C, VAL-SER-PHE-ILE-GLU-PHE-VAL-GLY-TRP [synthetic construct]